jgi:hypothetical protein
VNQAPQYFFDRFLEVVELNHIHLEVTSEVKTRLLDHGFLFFFRELLLKVIGDNFVAITRVIVRASTTTFNSKFHKAVDVLITKNLDATDALALSLEHFLEFLTGDNSTGVLNSVVLRSHKVFILIIIVRLDSVTVVLLHVAVEDVHLLHHNFNGLASATQKVEGLRADPVLHVEYWYNLACMLNFCQKVVTNNRPSVFIISE